MKLKDSNVRTFKPVKVFTDHKGKINYLSFSGNGNAMISSGDDDQMILYDCINGVVTRPLNSKKYGCTLIQFTHSHSQALHGSNKVDDTIRYLSLHDNKYIRYFQGHTKRVMSLHLSPVDDHFISGSQDNTVRLWDLRSPNCQGLMHAASNPVACFDPEGLIFAVGINSEELKLYDLRTFDKGPFATFPVLSKGSSGLTENGGNIGSIGWSKVKFSPDGKIIAICTNGPNLYLIDGYKGHIIHTLSMPTNATAQLPLDGTFTPDSVYFMSGTPDGRVNVWNVQTGVKVAQLLPHDHATGARPVSCLAFNPKLALLSTGSTSVNFWLPNLEEDID